jgi:hypothetical protein
MIINIMIRDVTVAAEKVLGEEAPNIGDQGKVASLCFPVLSV